MVGWGLVRQVVDRWFVAWSLNEIVREVSDRVYGLKDRQVFALFDRWLVLVAWSEICRTGVWLVGHTGFCIVCQIAVWTLGV